MVTVASVSRSRNESLEAAFAEAGGGFGDRRFVDRIELRPPPPITLMHLRGYYAGVRPPANALWAYIAAPAATVQLGTRPNPTQVRAQFIAGWEARLVAGALRDDFCAAGGRPLVGWTIGRGGITVSTRACSEV